MQLNPSIRAFIFSTVDILDWINLCYEGLSYVLKMLGRPGLLLSPDASSIPPAVTVKSVYKTLPVFPGGGTIADGKLPVLAELGFTLQVSSGKGGHPNKTVLCQRGKRRWNSAGVQLCLLQMWDFLK